MAIHSFTLVVRGDLYDLPRPCRDVDRCLGGGLGGYCLNSDRSKYKNKAVGRMKCDKCLRKESENGTGKLIEEQDQITYCDKCNRLIPVPLSRAGVKLTCITLLPHVVDGVVNDSDREIWQEYGHLLMSHLRDQFQWKGELKYGKRRT